MLTLLESKVWLIFVFDIQPSILSSHQFSNLLFLVNDPWKLLITALKLKLKTGKKGNSFGIKIEVITDKGKSRWKQVNFCSNNESKNSETADKIR